MTRLVTPFKGWQLLALLGRALGLTCRATYAHGWLTAPFTVLRFLMPLKMSYEAAKKRAEPYTKIVEELPVMWRDMVDLVRKAVAENRRAYVLVNNRSEGNAPLTIQALSDRLLEAPI